MTHKSRARLYDLRYTQGCDIYSGRPMTGGDYVEWLLASGTAAACPKTDKWVEMAAWLACFPTLWSAFRRATKRPHVMLLDLWSHDLAVSVTTKPKWVQLESVPSWLLPMARAQYRYALSHIKWVV